MALKKNIVLWFAAENGIDLSRDEAAIKRISDAAERAEIELRSNEETDINIPFITATESGPLHLEVTVSREWLSDALPWEATIDSAPAAETAPPLRQMSNVQEAVSRSSHTMHASSTFKKDSPLFSMRFILALSVMIAMAILGYAIFSRYR